MKSVYLKCIILLLIIIGISNQAVCQQPATSKDKTMVAGIPVNYDESKVGTYTLPDPLTLLSGKKVTNTDTWIKKRRPEIVKLFEENQFGKAPGRPREMSFNVFDKGTPAFGGTAIRKQVTVYFTKDTSNYKMDILIYLPVNAKKPSPLLLTISFSANASAVNDPGVKKSMFWNKTGQRVPAPAVGFGKLTTEQFLSQGIGVANICYSDIDPDFKEGIKYGIRSHYLKPGQTQPADDEWGAIAAWAWGLSRAMDYFETDKDINAKKVAITGASRLGKTVLWAGASDQRFAAVIASVSGESGAALSRRWYGETVKHMTDSTRFMYQFAKKYHSYGDDVSKLPMDGHMLISLIAPRPLLLQTGDTDNWSDPKGEFLAAIAAEPVYHLFGKKGLETTTMPVAGDTTMLNTLGYFMHAGPHGVLPGDYGVFVNFLKKHLLSEK
jgi:hypothetical protein